MPRRATEVSVVHEKIAGVMVGSRFNEMRGVGRPRGLFSDRYWSTRRNRGMLATNRIIRNAILGLRLAALGFCGGLKKAQRTVPSTDKQRQDLSDHTTTADVHDAGRGLCHR